MEKCPTRFSFTWLQMGISTASLRLWFYFFQHRNVPLNLTWQGNFTQDNQNKKYYSQHGFPWHIHSLQILPVYRQWSDYYFLETRHIVLLASVIISWVIPSQPRLSLRTNLDNYFYWIGSSHVSQYLLDKIYLFFVFWIDQTTHLYNINKHELWNNFPLHVFLVLM